MGQTVTRKSDNPKSFLKKRPRSGENFFLRLKKYLVKVYGNDRTYRGNNRLKRMEDG